MPFDLRLVPCKLSFEDRKASSTTSHPSGKRITNIKRKWYDSYLYDEDILFPRPSLVYQKVTRHEYLQEEQVILDSQRNLFKKSLNRETKKQMNEDTPYQPTTPIQVLPRRITLFRSRNTSDFENSSKVN